MNDAANEKNKERLNVEVHGETTSSVRVGTGPNQESVWDYPRPPVLVPDERKVEIYARNGDLLAAPQEYACAGNG